MKLRDALDEAYEASAHHLFNEGPTSEAVKILVELLEASGFVIVPKEATKEIEDAHFECHAKARTVFAEFGDLWREMLAARPKLDDAE